MSRRARRSYASDDPPRTPRAPVILPNGLNLSAFAFNPEAAAAAALQRQRESGQPALGAADALWGN